MPSSRWDRPRAAWRATTAATPPGSRLKTPAPGGISTSHRAARNNPRAARRNRSSGQGDPRLPLAGHTARSRLLPRSAVDSRRSALLAPEYRICHNQVERSSNVGLQRGTRGLAVAFRQRRNDLNMEVGPAAFPPVEALRRNTKVGSELQP